VELKNLMNAKDTLKNHTRSANDEIGQKTERYRAESDKISHMKAKYEIKTETFDF